MNMEQKNLKPYTLCILVQDIPGVLSQVARLFSRKGYNIESIVSGETDKPGVTRITIMLLSDDLMIEQIINQLRKLFVVYSVRLLPPDSSIRRELVLIKVKAESRDVRNEVIQIANIFRATIIDVAKESLTIAIIGDENKADAIQNLLTEFGILELARTGMVALERGQYTLDEDTKVKGEFDSAKYIH